MQQCFCKFIFTTILLLNYFTSTVSAQNSAELSLYKFYDAAIGKENLDINNGILLLNYDKTIKGTSRFYIANFESNSVFYNNQLYNDIILNYDILNDNVIIKPLGINDRRQLLLANEKIAYFTINNSVFRNLNYTTSNLPAIINGFYEEKTIAPKLVLYIKHIKSRRKIIQEEKSYDEFDTATSVLLQYNETFFELNSKKSTTAIFPELTSVIDTYYTNYNYLEKSNLSEFYEKLYTTINANLK